MAQGFGFGLTGRKLDEAGQSIYIEGGLSTSLTPAVAGLLLQDHEDISPVISGGFSISGGALSGSIDNHNAGVAGNLVIGDYSLAGLIKTVTLYDIVAGADLSVTLEPQIAGQLWILTTVDIPESRTFDVNPIDRTILVIGDNE